MNAYQANQAEKKPAAVILEDEDLALRVKLFLERARPELRGVTVSVSNGYVHLEGAVTTFHLRQLAVAAACRVAGVRQVIDDVVVAASPTKTWRADQRDAKLGAEPKPVMPVQVLPVAKPR